MKNPLRTRYVSIALGDWNLNGSQVADVARDACATAVRGHGADHAIVDGLTPVETLVLSEGGSDHHVILIRYKVGRREVSTLQWNVCVTQPVEEVRVRLASLIVHYRPTAVALSEAYHCGPMLADLAERFGYELSQGENVGEGADVALLIRKAGGRVWLPGPLRMTERWIGPKHGLDKQPREYRRGRKRLGLRLVVRFLALHGPFGDKPNTESNTEIVRWITQGARP